MSRVERNDQRDDWTVEAISFQPSAISRMVGQTATAVRQRNHDPKSEDLGHPVPTNKIADMIQNNASAAHRHLWDVGLLREQERWDNVGYLSGYVAECGVKAVIEMAGIAFRRHLPQISRDHLLLAADLSLAARRYPIDLDPDLKAIQSDWSTDLRYSKTGTLSKPDALRLCGLAEGVYHRTINAMILDGFIERPPT